jgi:psp operon transcriptional activator
MDEPRPLPRMIGESASFLEMQEHVSRVAPLNKPVLIVGERGTGKELVAARLHYLSRRWEQSFLKLNCATVSETLLEAQLFGHEAGAFTGATKLRKGYFERADGGTFFLDELANTAMPVQEKILRVIEYGEFERLGGTDTLSVDVRIIAATNEDLPSLAKQRLFREDLLDRLAFDVITLPPLRARKEDIMVLAEHFAVGMVKELGGVFFPGFASKIEKVLLSYDWPGNVRELRNVIERAVYQHGDKPVSSLVFNPFESPYRIATSVANADMEQAAHAAGNRALDVAAGPFDLKEHIQKTEISLLKQALEHCQFNQKKAAEHLGMSYHQLRGYLRKYELIGGEDQ